jgi:beta-N-acetylhexosaminidase
MIQKKHLGPLLIDLEGTSLTAEEKTLLQHPGIGGIILFARNIVDRSQVIDLTRSIREVMPTGLITVDQEGGRVQRLQAGFTRLPPLEVLGLLYNEDSQKAVETAHAFGWLMASEVLAVGIDLSFAPVCDCARVSGVIGSRALHSNPNVVGRLAIAYREGMRAAGMAATAKHFPGHGSVVPDSHYDLPLDDRSLEEILEDDAIPFAQIIASGVEAIMPAHIVFSKVDQFPVGFSGHWLKNILRNQLGFQGVIVSDDLSMKATATFGNFPERTQLALEAGCDLVLICQNRPAVYTVLKSIEQWPNAMPAIEKLRGQCSVSWAALQQDHRWHEITAVMQTLKE